MNVYMLSINVRLLICKYTSFLANTIFFSIFFVARSRLNISYLVLLYEIVMKFVIYMIKWIFIINQDEEDYYQYA